MTNEPEYCAECGFILGVPGDPPTLTCRPCGQKVCGHFCLVEHKRYCASSQEVKARKIAKAWRKR